MTKTGDLSTTMHESIAFSLAESSALKNGPRLSSEEMSNLIDRLFACGNNNFTPDGKKTITVFSHEEIDKRF